MFTGIIKKIAPIVSVTPKGECLLVEIMKPPRWKLSLGQSVAVDGICSTVVFIKGNSFKVEYMPETLSKTTAVRFIKKQLVNLEQPLTLSDFVDGGLVQGHVDEKATIKGIENNGTTSMFEVAIPKGLGKFIAVKGSVTLNGVNLTIAKKTKNTFTVALIPYTLEHTNLGSVKVGDMVNLEVDMLARYILSV